MASAFTQIGSARGAAKKAVAAALGVTASFQHRAVAAVDVLIKIVKRYSDMVEQNGRITERRLLVVEVPVQAGFARTESEGEPVTLGDTFTWLGRSWSVLDPIELDPAGYVYTLRLVEHKRVAQG